MHLLEGWFRRRFVPDGDGYLFRQWGQDVRFSREEFDGFIAERRRLWSSPLVWGIYLALGIVAPVWLFLSGAAAGAWTLGLIALVTLAVLLIHVDRRPNEAAQMRAVMPESPTEHKPTPPWMSLLWICVALFFLFAPGKGHISEFRWVWYLLLAMHLTLLIKNTLRIWRQRHEKSRPA